MFVANSSETGEWYNISRHYGQRKRNPSFSHAVHFAPVWPKPIYWKATSNSSFIFILYIERNQMISNAYQVIVLLGEFSEDLVIQRTELLFLPFALGGHPVSLRLQTIDTRAKKLETLQNLNGGDRHVLPSAPATERKQPTTTTNKQTTNQPTNQPASQPTKQPSNQAPKNQQANNQTNKTQRTNKDELDELGLMEILSSSQSNRN